MIFLARNRRRIPAQTPPPRERTAELPAARRSAHPAETETFPVYGDPDSPFTGKHARSIARPYVPRPEPDPLTAPDIPITETAVLGHLLSQSPVREPVWLTHRASDLRIGIRCLCHREHVNTNADTFHDLYASARGAGWQEDRFGTWRCPRCAKRYEAVLGVPPVAAIEAAA